MIMPVNMTADATQYCVRNDTFAYNEKTPVIVIIGLDGMSQLPNDLSDATGYTFDEKELLSEIVNQIWLEDQAVEQLEYYCLDLLAKYIGMTPEEELRQVIDFIMELGIYLHRRAKMYSLYRDGVFRYLFEHHCLGRLVLRREDEFYATIKNEFAQGA